MPHTLRYQLNLRDILSKPKRGQVSKLRRTSSPFLRTCANCSLPPSCWLGVPLHQANAQKARQPHKTPQKGTATHHTATGLPSTTVTEFCLNYPRYYFDLPAQYREIVYYRFKAAGLTLTPNVALTTELAKSNALREVAYKSLYEYCASIKFMYRQSTDEILFVYLYELLHMNTGPATLLTQYCSQNYQRSTAITPTASSEPASNERMVEDSVAGVMGAGQEASNDYTATLLSVANRKLEVKGWRFDKMPLVTFIDKKPGTISFKIEIDDKGGVAAVSKVACNVSPAQEKRCRETLLDAHFVKVNAAATATTGFYTYHFDFDTSSH